MDKVDNSILSQAIILAGGFGTRLQSVVSDRPKALADVSGKPFIEYQLEWLIEQGITDVTLAVHYMSDQLQDFIAQWSNKSIKLDSVYEQNPLGTGGAITNTIKQKNITGKVLVINGDTLFKFSIKPALKNMQTTNKSAILIGAEIKDVSRYGTITVDNGYVKSFQQATGRHEQGIVNGGAYIMESTLFVNINIEPFSLEYDFFPKLVRHEQLLAYIIDHSESFFDIGTPSSYKEICAQ